VRVCIVYSIYADLLKRASNAFKTAFLMCLYTVILYVTLLYTVIQYMMCLWRKKAQ